MGNESNEIRLGFETAYIDGNVVSNLAYRPQFVSNNHKEGKKVLSSIEDELLSCDQFQISVAFITMSGITPLLQTLKELEKKNIPGQILTTNYLNFSEPRALEKLNSLSNITLKMYDVEAAEEGFHTKGYIFKKEEVYRIIIGSSNITSAALTSNREWNTKLVSTELGEMAKDIVAEFKELWTSQYSLDFDDFYELYEERYEIIKHQREAAKQEEITSLEKYKLQPNSMQVGFINNLKKIISAGEERALLISATGTGKTYASAFAMRELGFNRVLFLVHRGQLARQTKKSYERVFAKTKSMGLVGAGYDDYDADYVFATVQTLNRDEHLLKYDADEFDCIVLDDYEIIGLSQEAA
ncbi:MAG: DEAD/DEAH box helicase family protein [Pseudobutyrivibrio sp.]|nr:DEAD/DEAH box helicase family protein [Pseudobutyrivibrio sp.]